MQLEAAGAQEHNRLTFDKVHIITYTPEGSLNDTSSSSASHKDADGWVRCRSARALLHSSPHVCSDHCLNQNHQAGFWFNSQQPLVQRCCRRSQCQPAMLQEQEVMRINAAAAVRSQHALLYPELLPHTRAEFPSPQTDFCACPRAPCNAPTTQTPSQPEDDRGRTRTSARHLHAGCKANSR